MRRHLGCIISEVPVTQEQERINCGVESTVTLGTLGHQWRVKKEFAVGKIILEVRSEWGSLGWRQTFLRLGDCCLLPLSPVFFFSVCRSKHFLHILHNVLIASRRSSVRNRCYRVSWQNSGPFNSRSLPLVGKGSQMAPDRRYGPERVF